MALLHIRAPKHQIEASSALRAVTLPVRGEAWRGGAGRSPAAAELRSPPPPLPRCSRRRLVHAAALATREHGRGLAAGRGTPWEAVGQDW